MSFATVKLYNSLGQRATSGVLGGPWPPWPPLNLPLGQAEWQNVYYYCTI